MDLVPQWERLRFLESLAFALGLGSDDLRTASSYNFDSICNFSQ